MYSDLRFDRNEVHVWHTPLTLRYSVNRLETVLSSEELIRAERYRTYESRLTFITTRSILRIILGQYLKIVPELIRFSYGRQGKPAVEGGSSVGFNVSHSGNQILIGISNFCDVGIDIEKVRPISDMWKIAERFFCREETAELMSLPESERELAFYRCWTRKEAYVKCIGAGLSLPLDAFQVTLRPDDPARLVHLGGDHERARRWNLSDILINSDYAAAIAYQGEEQPLRLLSISDADFILNG